MFEKSVRIISEIPGETSRELPGGIPGGIFGGIPAKIVGTILDES